MSADLLRVGLAFIEGFALIVSPCILPILPIMLSASLTGNRARPLGIIFGFVLTFTLFTLFSRTIIQYLHIDPDSLRIVSFAILILLGLIMLSDKLTEKFSGATASLLNVGNSLKSVNDSQGGFISGLLFGALVGIIWTPCAGPILAAVIVQVVIQKTTFLSVLTVLAFGLGAALPMLIIALAGRDILRRFTFFRKHSSLIRKLLGVIIIASVIAMIFVPMDVYTSIPTKKTTPILTNGLVNGLEKPYPAPQLAGLTDWINSQPLTMEQLKGNVVLIDFWTYSCINCIRTLPYLKNWYAKYHDKGLEIIGVHSPEFLFEHDVNNVKEAVTNFGISYPVALDNKFVTWQNFRNQYWPAHYLINKSGEVVYQHFGEGEYDTTENNIRFLLGIKPTTEVATEETYSKNRTPETYLGYAREENFASPETVDDNKATLYTFPAELTMNQWALQGTWTINSDKIIANIAGARLRLYFTAAKVFLVMGASIPTDVEVLLNGKPLPEETGTDVKNGRVSVDKFKLYTLVNLPKESQGMLELRVINAGLEMYAFTFG